MPSCGVITGSTRGIGLAVAMELAHRRYTPVLNYNQNQVAADRASAKLREICEETQVVRADVTTEEGVQALFKAALKVGPVGTLVNNVGQFHYKPFLESSIDTWKTIIDSNLLSAVLCCQQALASMRASGKGHIINIACMHADLIRPRPLTLPYAIAKSGLIHLTQTLAKTEAKYGIRVNAIGPGFIEGGEHTHPEYVDQVPLGQLGQPEDIAKAVGFLVSEDAAYITGVLLDVDGGALL